MKKIKLIHVTSSLQMGGAERTLFNIVKHLRDQFDQTVIYFNDGPFVQELQDLGISVMHIKGFAFRYDPFFFWRLYKTLKQQNPDVIHTLLWAANVSVRICAKLLGIPFVTVYHNNVEQDGGIRSFIDTITLRFGKKQIAVSEQVAQSLKKRTTWLPASNIEVITNGIEVPQLRRVIKRNELGIDDNAFVIGAVGRFVPVKQFDFLLRSSANVMKVHKHVYLLLVGTGILEQELRSLACQLDISDKVIFVVGKSAIDYYPLFDCFVQSSDKEGISIALLEAMHFSLPCIVMGHFYVHPVITHGFDGFVCPVGNGSILEEYVKVIIEQQKHILATIGDQAKKTICNQFEVKIMIHKYAILFKDLCKKNTK
ncbi:MAG: glycosyltransferase [Candidatus Dependentiae bacterium]